MHVSRITECSSRGGHDGGDELVRLLEGRLLDLQPIGCNARKCTIVENDDRVSILSESAHCEEAVVRIHNHVVAALRIWENGVCLDEFFGKTVIHALEDVASKS